MREARSAIGRSVRHAAGTFVLIAALAPGCGGGGTPAPSGPSNNPPGTNNPPPGTNPPAGDNNIVVGISRFDPSSTSVTAGTVVTWRWDSCTDDGYGNGQCVSHNVVFDDGSGSSGLRSTGSWSRQFTSAGTYGYHCTVHGSPTSGMRGSVAVQ